MHEPDLFKKPRIHHRVRARMVGRWQKTMESDRTVNALILVLIIASSLALIKLGMSSVRAPSGLFEQKSVVAPVDSVIRATFLCQAGKTIATTFSKREVDLVLSDGRELLLPQVISGSGARYANTDESFVFWNKGNTAFIEERGIMTYSGCVTRE